MKAYVIEEANKGVTKEVSVPVPNDDQVLIKVMVAGLCGTDAHIFKGSYYSNFPLIPGHEFCGTIEKVGKNVKNFTVGQRVTADPNIFCEKCSNCQENVQNFCKDFDAIGVTLDGAMAQYVLAPEGCVFDIGDMDFTTAAMIEPLSCVVYGQKRARPEVGDSVLIFGAGPIGLMHLQLAKHNGATFAAIVDVRQDRLDIAKKLGADLTLTSDKTAQLKEQFPEGFNMVIDSTGVPKVVESALTYVKHAGTFLIFGVCPQGTKIQVDPFDIYKRDLKIVGSFALKKTFQPAINLLRSKAIDVSDIIGEKITLEELPAQMDKFLAGKTEMKTVVYPNGLLK